ncbi:MAG: 30S ribosomal protein S17e [Nanoarchaeota archaeon]
MGRIRSTPIKRTGIKLFSTNKDLFKGDFESNKKLIDSLVETRSKKLRNVLAGYVTHLVKKSKRKPRRRKEPEQQFDRRRDRMPRRRSY